MSDKFRAIFFALVILFLPAQANAAKRIALVIGNAAYSNADVLSNPKEDAPSIAEGLKEIGFDVTEAMDLGYSDMRKTIRSFGRKAYGAEIAIIYFAGHGMELGGKNWLIPTDAALKSDADLEDEAVSLDYVMGKVEGTQTLALIILDACRDNPFKRTMRRVRGLTRSVNRGLSRVEPEGNMLVAFAARDGTVALDGKPGTNSPYASAWLRHMATPGLDIRILLGKIRDDVKSSSRKLGNYIQEPFFYGSLPGRRIELVAKKQIDVQKDKTPAHSAAAPSQSTQACAIWPQISETKSVAQVKAFLTACTDGIYHQLAKARLKEVESADSRETQTSALRSNKSKTTQASRSESGSQTFAARENQPAARSHAQIQYHFVGHVRPPDNWLSLRSQPSATRGRRMTKMLEGTLFQKLDQRGRWYKVRLRSGLTGWAHSRWIKCCKSLPVSTTNQSYHYVGPVSGREPWLALRTEPNTRTGTRLMKMPAGTPFKKLAQDGDWYQVKLRNGKIGWAHSHYIRCCKTLPN